MENLISAQFKEKLSSNQPVLREQAASGGGELSIGMGKAGVTTCHKACGRISCICWEDGPDYCSAPFQLHPKFFSVSSRCVEGNSHCKVLQVKNLGRTRESPVVCKRAVISSPAIYWVIGLVPGTWRIASLTLIAIPWGIILPSQNEIEAQRG